MQCECFNWARQFHRDKLVTKHHPRCEKFKGLDVEIKETIIRNLRFIDNIESAHEFSRYIMLNFLTNFSYDTDISELSNHIKISIETALLNRTKTGLLIDGIEYNTDKYTFHFSNDTHYNKEDNSYELLVNYIPYPLGYLILIEKKVNI